MECRLCPNNCIKRPGRCGIKGLKIAKYSLHFFEEPCISGKNGSGTVFFCGCQLKCVFCQNYELSRNLRGKEITAKELAGIFKELEDSCAENINLVNPSHYIPEIIEAVKIFKPKIPIVYNTHSYESLDALKLIDGYIDIYLADLKFYSPDISERYTGKRDYFEIASKNIEFMAKKPMKFENSMLKSGCLVRHLILPLCTDDTLKLLDFLKENLREGYLSLMSQYTPFGDIERFPELKRRITRREYEKCVGYLEKIGIERVFLQELSSAGEKYIPEWDF